MKTKKIIWIGLATIALVGGFFVRGDAGAETIDAATPIPEVGAEGGPSRILQGNELAQWIAGRRLFDHDFRETEGLGVPTFNGDSCRACHLDPTIGGSGGLDVNVSRFGHDGGNPANFTDVSGGQIASKEQRTDMPIREEYDPLAADVFEQRNTPTIFGAGAIESIPESVITANEDPNDVNGDGVRGFAHRINLANGSQVIGRFGWKAQVPTLSDFVHDAMFNELGITTIADGRGFGASADGDSIADPEFTAQQFSDILFFMQNLAAPPRGGNTDPGVAIGESLFTTVGCAKCHIPSLQGAQGAVPLFSDLLLHNVAASNFRGMKDGQAGPGFYRTAPLWGLRRTAPYMHDGGAETINAAILAHQGEAAAVVTAFNALSTGQKNALLLFLEDL